MRRTSRTIVGTAVPNILKTVLVALVFLALMSLPVYSDNSITYCKSNSTLTIQETFQICGNSPVLNPLSNNCQYYNKTRDELCAAGCTNGQCTPLGYERLILIVAFIVAVLLLIYIVRRYV